MSINPPSMTFGARGPAGTAIAHILNLESNNPEL